MDQPVFIHKNISYLLYKTRKLGYVTTSGEPSTFRAIFNSIKPPLLIKLKFLQKKITTLVFDIQDWFLLVHEQQKVLTFWFKEKWKNLTRNDAVFKSFCINYYVKEIINRNL